MTKLFLYKASDAPIILILRKCRANAGLHQFIKWNTDDNTFEEGQFLKHKEINPCRNAISSDGTMFYYAYTENCKRINDGASVVLSKIPNATAIYYGVAPIGPPPCCRFNQYDGKIPVDNGNHLTLRTYGEHNGYEDLAIDCETNANRASAACLHDSGLIPYKDQMYQGQNIAELSFTLNNDETKKYQVKFCQIFMNDELIYDCTDREFKDMKAV